jgi:hypothetical protein
MMEELDGPWKVKAVMLLVRGYAKRTRYFCEDLVWDFCAEIVQRYLSKSALQECTILIGLGKDKVEHWPVF